MGCSGVQSYTSKHNSAAVCWQKVEHLGRVSCEEVKVWSSDTQLHDGNRRTRLDGFSTVESFYSPLDNHSTLSVIY